MDEDVVFYPKSYKVFKVSDMWPELTKLAKKTIDNCPESKPYVTAMMEMYSIMWAKRKSRQAVADRNKKIIDKQD